MSLVLMSKEMAAEASLMHYRRGGEVKGVRRWQNEDGSYTSAGYEHYAEMYGWGKHKKDPGKGKDADTDTEKEKKKEPEPKSTLQKLRDKIDEKAEKNRQETRKESKDTEKQAESDAKNLIARINDKVKERREAKKAEPSVLESIRAVRDMSDEELNKQINRLNKEKQYAELVRERESREKGPLHAAAEKIFKQFTDNLTKKSLDMVVDKVVDKAKSTLSKKTAINIDEYKDTDLYTLDSEKLAALNQAFQNAANISRNRWAITHPNNNDNNGNQNNGGNKSNGNQNNGGNRNNGNQNNSGNNSGPSLSKGQKRQIRSLASSGKTIKDLAEQFGVSESYVQQLIAQ